MNDKLLKKIQQRKNISDLWFDLLEKVIVTKKETIIEVAPGYESKIGSALAKIDFKGTIHIVEPNKSALKFIVKNYSKIMPSAIIFGHDKMLHQFKPNKAPDQFILLSNHPFDDMILSSCIGAVKLNKIFGRDQDWIIDIKKYWNNFDKSNLEYGINDTVIKIVDFINKFKPKAVMLSNYKARTLTLNNLNLPNKAANTAINRIKQELKIKPLYSFKKKITSYGYENNWIIIK